jgi:hypothetical protein
MIKLRALPANAVRTDWPLADRGWHAGPENVRKASGGNKIILDSSGGVVPYLPLNELSTDNPHAGLVRISLQGSI